MVEQYQRTERLQPLFQQELTTRASDEAFGAATGRGLQQFAQGLQNAGQAVAAVQLLEDETRAKDAATAYDNEVRDLQFHPETGFMNTEGRNAVDGRDSYSKKLEEVRKKHAGGLTGKALEMFERASTARRDQADQNGMIHTSKERKSWINQSSKVRVESFASDALAAYNDPKASETAIANGAAELASYAEKNGIDSETLGLLQKNYVSGTRLNIVGRMADDDPVKANAYYQKHKDKFSGEHQGAIEKTLKEGLSTAEAQSIVGGWRDAGNNDVALDVVKRFEGFRSRPYWDVNAHRAGYGSDTVTDAQGNVRRVTPGTVVSPADAERDLRRRVGEFQHGIVRAIGSDAWKDMPSLTRAALTSVAYNYGSLPRAVISAALTGNPSAIASAVRGLKRHNDGVNAGRRETEADMIDGQAPQFTRSKSAVDPYLDFEDRLSKVTDPVVQQKARTLFNNMMEVGQKRAQAASDQLKTDAFAFVEQGGSPDDLPIDVRVDLGREGMTGLWSYHEAKVKRGEPETDATLLYNLRRYAAADPDGFSQANLLDHRDKLGNTEFKELTDLQTKSIGNMSEAIRTGKVYDEIYSRSEQQLKASGVIIEGRQDDASKTLEAKRVAEYQAALKIETDLFIKASKRFPTIDEQDQMIAKLIMPMVIETPGIFSQNTQNAFNFEVAGAMQPGAKAKPRIAASDVPPQLAKKITEDFRDNMGREPSEDEILETYVQLRVGGVPPAFRPNPVLGTTRIGNVPMYETRMSGRGSQLTGGMPGLTILQKLLQSFESDSDVADQPETPGGDAFFDPIAGVQISP